MQRSVDEKLRTPEEILAAMDQPGIREDSTLLYQLTAELHASLAKQSGETVSEQTQLARTGATIARVALFVAIFALAVGALQMVHPLVSTPPPADEEQIQQQIDDYQRQLDAAEDQIRQADEHFRRTSEQLDKADAQMRRQDALLDSWERQEKDQDAIIKKVAAILAEIEKRAPPQDDESPTPEPENPSQ